VVQSTPGHPCIIPQLGISLENAPAHGSRLIAAGLAEGRKEAGQ
jgi:hypothetical protein